MRTVMQLLCLIFAAILSTSAVLAETTKLVVANKSNTKVQVWLTIGQGLPSGCATKVTQISATNTSTGHSKNFIELHGNSAVGRIPLEAGESVEIKNSMGTCLNGNLTFNALTTCPCGFASAPPCPAGSAGDVTLPSLLINGSNFFEFNLNNGYESIDTSCNNGCNSIILFKTKAPSNWDWPSSTLKDGYNQAENGAVCLNTNPPIDRNCNIPGVYAYGLSTCTGGNVPCVISGLPSVVCDPASHTTVCQLTRSSSNGDTVWVHYIGGSQSPCAN